MERTILWAFSSLPSSGTKVTSEKLLLCEMLLIEIYPQSQYLLLDKPSCFPQSFSPDHLLVHILVHQSDPLPLNLAPVASSPSHLLSSSLGPCGARQVNARACLERSSFNVLRFFDTVLLKMYQFSSYRLWSLLAFFHKKLGMGEGWGLLSPQW